MGNNAATASRLASLRALLRTQGLDGLIVPHADEYQNEYIPPCAERLAWISGFTGSAGCVVVLSDRAALFVDGRYTLQAEMETDAVLFDRFHLVDYPPARWIADTVAAGTRLGFDPWLHTDNEVAGLRQACAKSGARLVSCPDNLIDAVWTDRPAPPATPMTAHPERYAGESSRAKRQRMARELAASGSPTDALIVSAPDSLAWLFNVRGRDVAHTPLSLARAILYADGTADLFAASAKITPALLVHLGTDVIVRPESDFPDALDALGGKTVRLDPARAPFWIADRLHAAQATVHIGSDPCQLDKACKNAVELEGARAAHRRDGAALCRFLAWLETADGIDECAAADRLEAFRREDPLFQDTSFATISGSGPNGAIIHYHATPATNRRLQAGELYLLDSGGQYPDGTTDVTRTVAVAPHRAAPGAEERRRFTLVLKGHIALSRAVFPKGTTGSQLDVLARLALWSEGLDYDHGTGHGVGSYLGVHEGPQRISKLPNAVPLLPGMIVSNEPGYYKPGAYGIRIENLLAVCNGPVSDTLAFEPLTLAPIDRHLIDPALLDDAERAWLDRYHAHVFRTLSPVLDVATVGWLEQATRPLG